MIRAAVSEDAGVVAALWSAMIRDTLATFTTVEKTAQDIDAMIAARPGAFLVAEEDGRVSGFMTFGAFRAGPGYAATVEHSIVVDGQSHGRGLGRALMDAGQEAARALGAHVMVAAVSGANPDAVAFHARLGFVEVGRMPEVGRKSGQWLDLVLMQKIL